MGEQEWEMARVLQGRPVAGKELTEEHIPLEAGLYHAVSLNKGCYMGQETLAKVHKLNAVKQQLQGLVFDAAVQPGTPLLSGEHPCSVCTACQGRQKTELLINLGRICDQSNLAFCYCGMV